VSAQTHGITCGAPLCPYFHGDTEGEGECRHRSPRAHRMRYDANDYISIWPPVLGNFHFCGIHPSLQALVRSGGVVEEDERGE
jgi:hypothetical protein